jgi:hypothetical protein
LTAFAKAFPGFPKASEWDPTIHRFRTASPLLNIAGVGGFDFCTLVELWGPPKSAKSTFGYQSLGECFLQDYGDNAMVLILDPENSANFTRLHRTFGLKIGNHPHVRDGDKRVFLEPAFTIEQGAETICRYAQKAKAEGKFLAVIWDSITVSKPKREYENMMKILDQEEASTTETGENKNEKVVFGTNMSTNQLRPQIIKWALNYIMTGIYMQPVIVFLVNQATTKLVTFAGGSTAIESSGGGYAFKHNIHYSIKAKFIKKIGENPIFNSGTLSEMKVDKSKVLPSLDNVKWFINDAVGGKLSGGEELVAAAREMKWFTEKNGGWLQIKPEELAVVYPDGDGIDPSLLKSLQAKDMFKNPIALDFLAKRFESYFRTSFELVNWTYADRDERLAENAAESVDVSKVIEKAKK